MKIIPTAMNKQGWTYKKLGEVAPKITDGSHNPPKGIDYSEYPMLSSKNIFFDSFNYDNPRYLSKKEFEIENKRTDISDGDVLLTIVGTVGRTCCVKKPFIPFTLQRSVAVLKLNKDILLPRFLMYSLHSLSDLWDKEAKGVAQKGIYLKQLASIPIPIPPVAEQERIVAELDLLSSIIEKKKEQLKAYDQLAQSIFYTMFGDPIDNPKGWQVKKYGDCFIIGSGGTPSKAVSEYWEGGRIPWIGSNMCQNCIIEKTDGKFITEEGLNHSSAKVLESGSVLVALVGATIGKVALLKTNTAINQNIAFIKLKNTTSFIPEFVYYHLMGQYDEFMNLGDGKFKMANQAFIKSLSICIPPLPLQQEFAEKVEAIEKQKALIQQSIDEVQTLFDSRMDYWFG